jgi:hypothetical protein
VTESPTTPGPLSAELANSRTRGRKPAFTDQERAERAKMAARAQTLALGVLKARHEEEYQTLYQQAKAEVGLD